MAIINIYFQTTGNSNAMEMKGLKECLHEVLTEWKILVTEFISDRHIQVRAYMRDNYGKNRKDRTNLEITHYLDIWHVAKST